MTRIYSTAEVEAIEAIRTVDSTVGATVERLLGHETESERWIRGRRLIEWGTGKEFRELIQLDGFAGVKYDEVISPDEQGYGVTGRMARDPRRTGTVDNIPVRLSVARGTQQQVVLDLLDRMRGWIVRGALGQLDGSGPHMIWSADLGDQPVEASLQDPGPVRALCRRPRGRRATTCHDNPVGETVTTFEPAYPGGLESVYVGGEWNPITDTFTGGRWERPTHGGLCRGALPQHDGPRPRAAIIGPHLHWNGDYYMACGLAAHCDTPSCHPATPEDYDYTLWRERREIALWNPDLATEAQLAEAEADPFGVWQGLKLVVTIP